MKYVMCCKSQTGKCKEKGCFHSEWHVKGTDGRFQSEDVILSKRPCTKWSFCCYLRKKVRCMK